MSIKLSHTASFTRSLRRAFAAGVVLCGAVQAEAAGFVLAYADVQVADAYANLQKFHIHLSAVGLGSAYALGADGSVLSEGVNATSASIVAFAKSKNIPLYPTVSDYDNAYGGFNPAISNAVLATSASRATAVRNLVALATSQGFAGINVDLEAVQPASRANYASFLVSLSAALRVNGMKMIVSVPAKVGDATPDFYSGFDYAAIGNVADYLQVMTYDQVGPGWSTAGFNQAAWPGPESGLDWQRAVLTYAKSRVQPDKVLSGMPSYGYDYSTGNLVHWSDFSGVIAAHAGARLGRDAASATPFASWGTVTAQTGDVAWSKASAQPVLWYDDAQSIQAKTALVASLGLGGTSVWAMGYEDAAFWSALTTGIKGSPSASLAVAAAAGTGGSISPSGSVKLVQGSNQTFAIVPSPGYAISAVTVDGAEIGAISTYTFNNVQADHAIAASFAAVATGQGNLERSGKGYLWASNKTATSNANRRAAIGLNDGNLGTGVNLNAAGEGGAVRWEAAGVLWSAAKTVSSVKFVNGAADAHGNGFFETRVSLQFTTDGQTWVESGWQITPSYAYGSTGKGATYTFTGTERRGVLGVRISGATGSSAWSAIVNEVQVIGR